MEPGKIRTSQGQALRSYVKIYNCWDQTTRGHVKHKFQGHTLQSDIEMQHFPCHVMTNEEGQWKGICCTPGAGTPRESRDLPCLDNHKLCFDIEVSKENSGAREHGTRKNELHCHETSNLLCWHKVPKWIHLRWKNHSACTKLTRIACGTWKDSKNIGLDHVHRTLGGSKATAGWGTSIEASEASAVLQYCSLFSFCSLQVANCNKQVGGFFLFHSRYPPETGSLPSPYVLAHWSRQPKPNWPAPANPGPASQPALGPAQNRAQANQAKTFEKYLNSYPKVSANHVKLISQELPKR